MIRHTLLPAPGTDLSAIRDGGSSGHLTTNAPTANTMPRTRPTTASLLITDPDTVTHNRPATVGRAQRSLRQ